MTTLVYWALWILFRVLATALFRVHFLGQERIPRKGGLLIVANHASILDIPLLGCGIRRHISFMGRDNLFPIPLLNPLLQRLGWIPIRQNCFDRKGFRRAERLLREGQAVAIFPEGARTETGQLGEGKSGFATLVAKTGCLVLPAYIHGTFEALPAGARWVSFRPVTVVYGEPIDFAVQTSLYPKKEMYRRMTARIMETIAELSLQVKSANPICTLPKVGRPVPSKHELGQTD
jgi:1-acyl-sn-glycerol-3-phosphate acyltransferase